MEKSELNRDPAHIRETVLESMAHAATVGVSTIKLIDMLKTVLTAEKAAAGGNISPQHAVDLKLYNTLIEYHGLLMILIVMCDSAGIVTLEQLYHAIPEDARETYKDVLYKLPEAYKEITDALVQPQIQL